ncbi:MAG TPA: hypothetical protein VN620_11210 [Candidatus Methylomirabilis sp.]|nr:hypothetical protein [Candidatus Methylomirabilis sp.]
MVPQAIEFRDPDAAARNLARVQMQLGSEAFRSLLYILAESPDPDSAVIMLGRLLDVARDKLVSASGSQSGLLRYACEVFAHSTWLGETLIRDPELLQRVAGGTELGRSWSCEEFREEFARLHARSAVADLSQTMSRFRKREYVRILLRDVLRIAKIGEVTEEISALSDALLQEAVTAVSSQLIRRHGAPRWVDGHGRYGESRFAVVSLGKLGGNELNYSSDVDLIFLYDGGQAPPGARVSNREYFIELAQKTTELLSRPTLEGLVFRIDLRLRPQGHEGELAVALPRAIQYYSEVAQDWELQAMIKARHSAGHPSLTREFVHAIAPLVYRHNVDFAAIKTALQTRERIDKWARSRLHAEARMKTINVKLDRGGIRDVEFLVQCLQRVYGGEEPWLRSRGTLFALQKLHDKQHITGTDFHTLSKAYEFLRDIEHHLQLKQGQQNHQLPADVAELKILARQVRREAPGNDSSKDFVMQVRARMAAVSDIYRLVIYRKESVPPADTDSDLSPPKPATTEDYSRVLRRLTRDAPELLATINRLDPTPHARRNLDRFLNSAATSSERFGALLRATNSIQLVIDVFELSEYLSEILIRHPTDVEILGRADVSATVHAGSDGRDAKPERVVLTDPQQSQAVLRQQFRRAMLTNNARDLARQSDIWELLRRNSMAADQALVSALALCNPPSGFAILALGRLGSGEFDVLSDADVLFVADESANLEQCCQTAEQITGLLTAYTRDGTVFPVDARLRPYGAADDLVTTPSRLAAYFAGEAQPWEAITYLRLRFVAGSLEAAQRAVQVVRDGIFTIGKRPEFARELWAMRQRLEASDAGPNLKTGPGGTYDLDFLTGRLQAEHAAWSSDNLAARIALLEKDGRLHSDDARELSANATFLRNLEHCVRLVTGRPDKWLPVGDHARAAADRLMAVCECPAPGSDLEQTLSTTLCRNREICLKYLFD